VVALDSAALARIDDTVGRAEEIVRRSKQAVETRRRVDDSYVRRIDRAYAATEREIESIKPARVGLSLRIAAWRRRRKHHRTVARLQRALTRQDLAVADRSSAALLAIVTERITRLSSSNALPHEFAEAIELSERIVADYVRQIEVIERQLYRARAELTSWRDKAATAVLANATNLAAGADERVTMWKRRVDEGAVALAACDAGKRRIDDALVQLRAIAQRSASRVPT
jgi:hypothetical protein